MRKQVEFDEIEEQVVVTLRTKCPEKYLLIDREKEEERIKIGK